MKEKSEGDLSYHLLPSFPLYLIQMRLCLADWWLGRAEISNWSISSLCSEQEGRRTHGVSHHHLSSLLAHLDYVLTPSSVTNRHYLLIICDGGIYTSQFLIYFVWEMSDVVNRISNGNLGMLSLYHSRTSQSLLGGRVLEELQTVWWALW